jgi:hypothetical protein
VAGAADSEDEEAPPSQRRGAGPPDARRSEKKRSAAAAQATDDGAGFAPLTGVGSKTQELLEAKKLFDEGLIEQDEFRKVKAKIFGLVA